MSIPTDILSNVALGVLGSFVASILFLAALYARRPKIQIAHQIAKTTLNRQTVYSIKVINCGWFDCINVQAELVLVQPDRVSGGIAKRIGKMSLLKDSVFVLRSPRTAVGANGAAAFRFVTVDDLEGEWRKQEYLWRHTHKKEPELRPYVHLVIYAQDGLSNFGRVLDRSYTSFYRDLISGEYEHGLSLEINSIPTIRVDN